MTLWMAVVAAFLSSAMHRGTRSRSVTIPTRRPFSVTGRHPTLSSRIRRAAAKAVSSASMLLKRVLMMSRSIAGPLSSSNRHFSGDRRAHKSTHKSIAQKETRSQRRGGYFVARDCEGSFALIPVDVKLCPQPQRWAEVGDWAASGFVETFGCKPIAEGRSAGAGGPRTQCDGGAPVRHRKTWLVGEMCQDATKDTVCEA